MACLEERHRALINGDHVDGATKDMWQFLWNDCMHLYSQLGEFTYLYAENENRVKLMNGTASFFFAQLQRTLWDNMFLRLCRLTDPAKVNGRENLSLVFYLQASALDRSNADQDRSKILVEEARVMSEFARLSRNKRIAHHDFATVITKESNTGATLADLRKAVAAVGAAIDSMDPAGGQTSWDPGPSERGCRALLDFLREGKISYDRRWRSFERGEIGLRELWSEDQP